MGLAAGGIGLRAKGVLLERLTEVYEESFGGVVQRALGMITSQ